MNRRASLLLVISLLGSGCAASVHSSMNKRPIDFAAAAPDDEAGAIAASTQFFAPASSLVFDLPVAQGQPPLDLWRDEREPGAFVGYEGPSIEYHTVLINNTQVVGGGGGNSLSGDGTGGCGISDGYVRQDIVQRTNVRYR